MAPSSRPTHFAGILSEVKSGLVGNSRHDTGEEKWGRAAGLAANVSSQVVLVSPSYHGRSTKDLNPDRRVAVLTPNEEWPSYATKRARFLSITSTRGRATTPFSARM